MKNVLLLTLLVACGDSNKQTPDAPPGTGDAPADAAQATPSAVVLGADFSSNTGVVSKLDVATLNMQQNVVAGAATSDPVLHKIGNKLYIVNRSVGENVTVLDATTLALVGQYSTGAGSNPQDVAVVGDKLYLPAYGTAGVVVLQLPAGTIAKTIALDTAVGDPDGKPDCTAATAVGNDVYVSCGLLDASFTPRGPGKVAVIDTASDTVRTTIALPDKNPQGFLVKTPQSSAFAGDLLVALEPTFDGTTGCIARITPGQTPTAACASGLDGTHLGGFASGMSVGPDALYVPVAVSANYVLQSATIRKVDLATGMLVSAPLSGSTEMITDVAACPDGSVVATDQTMNAAGVRVFASGTERTTSAMAIGLPPIFSGGVACY